MRAAKPSWIARIPSGVAACSTRGVILPRRVYLNAGRRKFHSGRTFENFSFQTDVAPFPIWRRSIAVSYVGRSEKPALSHQISYVLTDGSSVSDVTPAKQAPGLSKHGRWAQLGVGKIDGLLLTLKIFRLR